MSEQKKITKIEDAIVEYLDGDLKETALKLTAYLNESDGLSLVLLPWELDKGKTIAFKIKHRDHYIGWILVKDNGEWLFDNFNFSHLGEFYDDDKEFTAAVYEHINPCTASCGCCPSGEPCQLSRETTVFGKKFYSVCFQHTKGFINPDEKTLGYIKKLIEYGKKINIPHEGIYHCNNL